jgi:DNA-binding transcriptional regulator GbsR (MarR family)
MATLLIEGRELSHKEIAKQTGYSISSVSRTLDQMVRMGIVHKHKDPVRKHFAFDVSVAFPEMIASGMETMLKVYHVQREEIKKLTRKVHALKPKDTEAAELQHVQKTLHKIEKTIAFVEGIMRDAIDELHT